MVKGNRDMLQRKCAGRVRVMLPRMRKTCGGMQRMRYRGKRATGGEKYDRFFIGTDLHIGQYLYLQAHDRMDGGRHQRAAAWGRPRGVDRGLRVFCAVLFDRLCAAAVST